MPITIIENIKGSELPESWKKKAGLTPDQTFTITIKPINEEEEMPPEEMISDKLVESVKRSEEDHRTGRYTRCRNKEESDQFFQELWDE